MDGDPEGKRVNKLIKNSEYKNLDIKKFVLSEGKEIEDMVYSKSEFIKRVLSISPSIKEKQEEYKKVIDICKVDDSLIAKTEEFIKIYGLDQNIYDLKNKLSTELDSSEIQKDWIISDLEEWFY